MPEPWTIPWYKDFIQKEANQTPAKTPNSVSMKLDLANYEYAQDQLKDSFVLDAITMKDIQDFLNELKTLQSYRYSDLAHRTRQVRCWTFWGWYLPVVIITIVLAITTLGHQWWIIFPVNFCC